MSAKTRWMLNVLLAVGSLGVSLAVMEVVARLFLPQWAPRTARLTQFWRFDPHLGWLNAPNSSGRFDALGFRSAVNHNARGFRGPVVPYQRTGSRRLLVLGDSFVWGFGVSDEETLTEAFTRMQPGWEAVNLGVSGFSTDQELLLYQAEGRRYQADAVVLMLCSNDIPNNLASTAYLIYGKPVFRERGGELELLNQPLKKPSWPGYAAASLTSRSYVLSAASRVVSDWRKQISSRRAREAARPQASSNAPQGFPRNPAESITGRLLVELKRAVAARQPGARFVVVLVEDLGAEGTRLIGDYLREREIEYIPLIDYIAPDAPALHVSDGLHWSARGHETVARVLAARLAAEPARP
ncbi:MAG: SGNH/GDSL hydrolase family protein [Acidobacteria bacterium]|nr:SGNH/GDSL hydrolase family protein [Acidobacteriota bacterium]